MFVERDGNGKVKGIFTAAQHEGQEELPDDHPDVEAFRNEENSASEAADAARALSERRAAELLASPELADQIKGLKIKLELLGG